MTWDELIRSEIEKLEKEKIKTEAKIKKLDNHAGSFAKNVKLMANVKSIEETIYELYVILGRKSEVTK